MPDVTASRTLVKSAPELWTECSDAGSLSRHLDSFGEIRITRLEPETAVAWEGEHASGTVRLEPSGWGTRVVLTATPAPSPEGSAEPQSQPERFVKSEPAAVVEPESAVVVREPEPVVIVEPDPVVEVEAEVIFEAAPALASTDAPAPVRKGFFARLRAWFAPPVPEAETQVVEADDAEAAPVAEPAVFDPEPVALDPEPVGLDPEPVGLDPELVGLDPELVALDPEPVAEEPPAELSGTEAALAAALDSLGQAHHRPYSRS